jgi:hypothetical protein
VAIYYENGNEPSGPQNSGDFLTSSGTVSFSRDTLLNGFSYIFRLYRKQPFCSDSTFPMFVKVNHEHRQVHLALYPVPVLAALSVLPAQCKSPLVPGYKRVNVLLYGQGTASRYDRLNPEWELQVQVWLGRTAGLGISNASYPLQILANCSFTNTSQQKLQAVTKLQCI